jgi:hypothetical protein
VLANADFVMTEGIQTVNGTKAFGSTIGVLIGGIALTSGSTLNYYHETTHATTFNGLGFTSASQTLQIVRIGKTVTIRFPAFTGTASIAASLNSVTALGTAFRPTVNLRVVGVCVRDNGTDKIGCVDILTTGIMNIYAGAYATNFSNTGRCGLRDTCITYTII